ncbi:hypothetical protein BHE74_00036060 [Ensete ventricosum]|nr:hypothetical protein BHE74_00036060 [Ensete ventricosum]RZS05859.1 hypothetical protein BHM03_00036416 [Ensete ventricosum]
MIIVIRLVVVGFFFHYRITNPASDAYPLWLISVICEIWFALSWILDQFPKWLPIERETYLDRLSLRYEKEGQPSQLSPIDIFVSTVDPMKEPPLITANTVLSILAVDYPVEKVSCYVSDDGAAMLTFEALSETSEFAKKWVPFCKKFNIEPRAPEWYFQQKMDYLKDKVHPSFIKERRAMKVRVSAVLTNAPYLLNVDCDHYFNNSKAIREAMCFMMDPLVGKRVCYVQFPQRFDGIDRHDRYANRNIVFFDVSVTFYSHSSVTLSNLLHGFLVFKFIYVVCIEKLKKDLMQINMKGLDGIQGPIYVGTGCAFRRQALYGYDAPKSKKPPTRTCNCWPKWCCCGCCCSGRRKKKMEKAKQEKNKNSSRRGDSGAPVFALEGIEEGKQGMPMPVTVMLLVLVVLVTI